MVRVLMVGVFGVLAAVRARGVLMVAVCVRGGISA